MGNTYLVVFGKGGYNTIVPEVTTSILKGIKKLRGIFVKAKK